MRQTFRQWLLAEDMTVTLKRIEALLVMQKRRSTNTHNIGLRLVKHLLVAVVDPFEKTGLFHRRPRRKIHITTGDESHATLEPAIGREMNISRDRSQPDDGKTNHCALFFMPTPERVPAESIDPPRYVVTLCAGSATLKVDVSDAIGSNSLQNSRTVVRIAEK